MENNQSWINDINKKLEEQRNAYKESIESGEVEKRKLFFRQSTASKAAHQSQNWNDSLKIAGAKRGFRNKGVKKSSNKKYIEHALNRPEEHNKKISESLTGTKHTEERLQNMSNALKKRKTCPYCNTFESNVANTNRHMNKCSKNPNLI